MSGMKQEAGQWKAEYERLAEAVRFAIDYAGGRESEWGERAEECFRILETAVSRKPEQPQPAEDPDEWVVLDPMKYPDHVLRPCDYISGLGGSWHPASGRSTRLKDITVVSCRRRDLPKV